MVEITEKEIDELYALLKTHGESHGYYLNPDKKFVRSLLKGILTNKKRYGYWACPCRLGTGKREKDLDIICPCDYRDTDINEHGTCYCSLYVFPQNSKIINKTILERRNLKMKQEKLPVWRCKVCGYLCSREHPPDKCPICLADKDRFENFRI